MGPVGQANLFRYPSSGLYSSQIVEFTPTNASDLSGRSSTNVTHVIFFRPVFLPIHSQKIFDSNPLTSEPI
ncbi:unnamed protein product [Toxocara canis]|uniref:Ovule protein n=1 Tax=Toxocara canis TaxID=6265 RepID=A0A183UZ21_TOXCA|nr:unnamed protein product [Toxocara canis]